MLQAAGSRRLPLPAQPSCCLPGPTPPSVSVPLPPPPQVANWAADAMVGACPPLTPAPATNCSRLWLDHTVSVHTGGANMTDYGEGGARVARFLHLMALYASSFTPALEGLVGRLRLA